MTDIIRLYRGDSTKIPEFDLKKAKSYCLVGQGIYLTDNSRVAASYKVKGIGPQMFMSEVTVKTKNDVVAAVVQHFFEFLRYNRSSAEKWNYEVPSKKFKELKDNEIDDVRKLIIEGIEKKRLIITRVKQEGDLWIFKVEEDKSHIGWVSVFEFPEPEFSRNCVNLDAYRKDPGLLELLDDARFWEVKSAIQASRRYQATASTVASSRLPKNLINSVKKYSSGIDSHEDYLIARASRGNLVGSIHLRSLDFRKLISALKPYGVHGFEYSGGIRLGGHGNHRAFSIWDDDYVNDHKVRRYK